jgi:hypothetical protein
MCNSRKRAAMAVLGVGLAVAAATPASAGWPYAGGCGYAGYADTPAYAGVYSYGWPYGTVGDAGCGAYGYTPAFGHAGGCGYRAPGYPPSAAYGYGPADYRYGCRGRHLHGHGGYALAYASSARRHFDSAKQIAADKVESSRTSGKTSER